MSKPDPGRAAQRRRAAALKEVPPGSRWRHAASGKVVTAINVEADEETLRLRVSYFEEDGSTWGRWLDAWREPVVLADGSRSPRFVREVPA